MSIRPICAIDTETTSLGWDREAWEVAIIRREPDGVQQEWRWYADVQDLSKADPQSLEIGGFYRRHPLGRYLSGSDTFMEHFAVDPLAPERIVRLTHGATIVGAVPSFDTHVLETFLRSNRHQPTWHHRLRCVETLTAGHLGREVGGLAKCAEALGIEFPQSEQHTALGDARMALAIYDKILGGAE
jgi:hypothetical protein